MALNTAPLGSASYFTPALYGLQNASNDLATSTARLSSGNRIINVSDDVAAFSIAAGLQSQLSGLKQASSNIAQGTSLLQVASGGLSQISTLLTNLQSLAVQANSSAITNTQRSFLQQQFNSTLASIDSIASTTMFNNLNLLDGTLAGGNLLLTQQSPATKAHGQITLSAATSAAQTIKINGVTLTAGSDFATGIDAQTSASNLANALNNSTNPALSQATYQASGSSINITARTGGTLGDQFIIDQADSTVAFSTNGSTTNVANIFTLTGGLDTGLGINSTKAIGTVNDAIVTAQNQTSANVTLSINGAVSDGENLQLGDGNGGLVTFTFRNAPTLSNEIQIGGNTQATLQNIAAKLSQYSSSDNYGIRQLSYSISAGSLTLTNRTIGNVNDLNGNPLAIAATLAHGSLSGASFNNGTTSGVNVSGIANGTFTGTLQGFTTTYVSPNVVNASLTVGSSTYLAHITNTAPAANTSVRFTSSSGDYFDIQLAGTHGMTVNNTNDAANYAAHLNAVFSGLNFYQNRVITNFTPPVSIAGSNSSIQLGTSNTPVLNTIVVSPPTTPGTDGTIAISINGNNFQSPNGIGATIGAYQTIKLTNQSNSNQYLTLTNGGTAQDFSNSTNAAALQQALVTAFNLGKAQTGTNFQVGVNPTDTINVSINSTNTYTLFNGVTPNIGSQINAAAAETAITTASNTVQTIISSVGGSQDGFNAAGNNLNQSIAAVTAASSALVDTNIVTESSTYAQDTLKVNASLAVLAQTLSLPSNLLSLIKSAGKS